MQRLSIFLSALAVLVMLSLAGAALAAPSGEAAVDGTLDSLWATRLDDLASVTDEVTVLQDKASRLSAPVAGQVQDARNRFARLSTLFQASRGHPTEQLTLYQQMRGVHDELRQRLSPLAEVQSSINQHLNDIASTSQELETQTRENRADLQGSDPGTASLREYSRSLTQARSKLQTTANGINRVLEPANLTLDQMKKNLDGIEASLSGIWEAYYLTPSANSLDVLTAAPSLFADWLVSLRSRIAFAYPQDADGWLLAGVYFLFSACVMAGIGFFIHRGALGLSGAWRYAVNSVLRGSWIYITVGWSLLMASGNQAGGVYFGFVLFGALILIAGISSMIWKMRLAEIPSLEGQPSPLFRLYPPAALGVLMLFSDLPTRILGLAWALVMLGFWVATYISRRRRDRNMKLPLLERFAYACSLWFSVASLGVCLWGYARLAILLFMFLAALISTFMLAKALMGLLDILASKAVRKEERPFIHALLQALSIPLAWILSLVCAVPWIWAVPGATYLIRKGVRASYSLGDASFDFSRIVLIVLLFFIFRGLLRLGRTSLDQLPNRLPTVERGVIPPLKTMATYACWALFAIVVLSLLGVNFTSLAVVAGGLSVGIGFGMQNLFNNLVSGLMLLFGRTILVGDYVVVDGVEGTVTEINIRSTVLETPEQATVYVPNSTIMAGQFINWTRNTRRVRRSLLIGVSYGSDTELVKKLLFGAAEKHEHVLRFPPPDVLFTGFGASSLDFTMNVFIDDISNAGGTLSDLRFTIFRLFEEHGVDIPYPQLTLHRAGFATDPDQANAPENGLHAGTDTEGKEPERPAGENRLPDQP